MNARMIQHALEHGGIALLRHLLILIAEIPVIIRDEHRHSAGNGRIDFFCRISPLLHRIVLEDMLEDIICQFLDLRILVLSQLQDRHFMIHAIGIDEHLLQMVCLLLRKQHLDGSQIEWNRNELSFDIAEHPVLIRKPVREPGQEVNCLPGIGMEDMRSVLMAQNLVLIQIVIRISADMVPLLENQYLFSIICQASCGHCSAIPCADNHCIINHNPNSPLIRSFSMAMPSCMETEG